MHRAILLAIGTTVLFNLNTVFAVPQTRRPTSTATPPALAPTPRPGGGSPPPDDLVVHDVVDDVLCTDPLKGTTTAYESHDVDIEEKDPLATKHRLAKRGNCFSGTVQYYSDPPYLEDMIRPVQNRVPQGIHYGAYRPPGDASLARNPNAVQDTEDRDAPDENLVAEASLNDTNDLILAGGNGGGGGNNQPGLQEDDDYQDEFVAEMDEYNGEGLNESALDFERGVLQVPGGVGGGLNGGFSARANRRRVPEDFNDVVRAILANYENQDQYGPSDDNDFSAHGLPEESPLLDLDRSHSIIDEGTLDEMRRAVAEELASGYDNVGHPGDIDEFPDGTEIPLQSVLTGQESEFPEMGSETLKLFWGDNRADLRRGQMD